MREWESGWDSHTDLTDPVYVTVNGALRVQCTKFAFDIEAPKECKAMSFRAVCEEFGEAPVELVDAARESAKVEVTMLFGKSGKRLVAECRVQNVHYVSEAGQPSRVKYELVGSTHGRFK
jgi:hypothetical protein